MVLFLNPELLIGRNKDLVHDLCNPVTSGTDNIETWRLPSSQQQNEEGEADDDTDDSCLTDCHPEQYEELTAFESEDDESDSHPNRKPESQENTHSEGCKDYEAEDGVMVRDPCGKPVIASACVQPEGVAYYYHVLDGVKPGLALALAHETYDLVIFVFILFS